MAQLCVADMEITPVKIMPCALAAVATALKYWMFADSESDDVLSLCVAIQKLLRLCCDADWSTVTGRRSSDTDPVFISLAQNVVGHYLCNKMWRKVDDIGILINLQGS